MRQQGIDPSRNIYAAQILQRAPESQWLAQAANVQDTGMEDFAKQWINARFNGGGSYGGVDLSRQGTTNYLQGALQNNDPNSLQYQMFNSGDPEADYANLGSAMGIMQGGYSPMARAASQRTLGNWYERALGQMQAAGPGTPTNLLNYYYGRQDAGPGSPAGAAPLGAVPPGQAGQAANTAAQTTAYASQTPAQQAQTLAQQNAAQAGQAYQPPGIGNTVLGGQTTPGLPPVNPNLTTFPSTPTNRWEPTTGTTPPSGYGSGTPTQPGQPGQQGAVTSWTQLLDKYKADQRNWGTRGFRPNPGAFNIGGISYDPTKDAVTGFNNMSGSGRVTNRGNMMGQFLYYLNLLRTQRDGAGNRALGITRATTDDQLAQIAKQRMSQNAIGSTGFA
jgi:hypothetical protein